jgi:thiol:disulfide interchange protein DsbD
MVLIPLCGVLVGMAAYFVRPLLSELQSIIVYSAIAAGVGIHLGWMEKSTARSPGFGKFRKVLGLCCLGFVVVFAGKYLARGPGVSWVQYSETVLDQASAGRRPVIIDFYAAWCTPCRELDDTTFHNLEVVKESQQVVMIKIDLATGGTP